MGDPTGAMEPTMRLRWVERPGGPMVKPIRVLQQLWVLPVVDQQPMEEPLIEEWRDVPVVESE